MLHKYLYKMRVGVHYNAYGKGQTVYVVMVPRNTVLVGLSWSSVPPTTNTRLNDSCTAVQAQRDTGRSPVVALTQELVRGKKTWTAGEAGCLLSYPPTARFPLRLAAAALFSGVSGRVFQTDVWLADW